MAMPLETSSALGLGDRLRVLIRRDATGALVLAAAIPILFVHERYQPTVTVGLGTTSVDLRLSDAALVAVLVAAAVTASRVGLERLRPGIAVWLPGLALLVWLAFETFRPVSRSDALFDDHVVTAAKFLEYAALALAVPFLVRNARDLTIVLGAFVLWAAIATAVAVMQFFGLDIFGAWNPGWRQPSFLGHQDLAGLSTIALALAAAGIVVGKRLMPAATLFLTALAAGVVGLILAGSVAAAGGLAVGAVFLVVSARGRFRPSFRRVLALAAIVVVVVAGVTAIRGNALADFLHFVGISRKEQQAGVETYSQRTVLVYIGLRIFQDHPLIGVGFERSDRPDVFEPYLADAHRRFPSVVDLAFPSAEHPWGVQNLYVQMLADAGVVGLVLLLVLGVGGVILAWRTAAYASNPWAAGAGLAVLCALLTLAGEWSSLGIVAGIPLQAATSLLLGLAAAGAAAVEEESSG